MHSRIMYLNEILNIIFNKYINKKMIINSFNLSKKKNILNNIIIIIIIIIKY